MTDILERLPAFSNEQQLWENASAKGKTSLANHFKENSEECNRLFGGRKAADIQFVPAKQVLTFHLETEPAFIVSTVIHCK